MKTLTFTILLILFFAGAAAGLTPEERAVVTQMKDTIVSLRAKLTAADRANASALTALTKASNQMTALQDDLRIADTRFKQTITERDQYATELQKAKERYEALNKRYQTAQFIIAIVSAVLTGLVVFYFSQALLPPYNVIAPLGAATTVFAAIYFIL
jgi:chromosome segregation ATPase